jgi:prophage DNA circulation protein
MDTPETSQPQAAPEVTPQTEMASIHPLETPTEQAAEQAQRQELIEEAPGAIRLRAQAEQLMSATEKALAETQQTGPLSRDQLMSFAKEFGAAEKLLTEADELDAERRAFMADYKGPVTRVIDQEGVLLTPKEVSDPNDIGHIAAGGRIAA